MESINNKAEYQLFCEQNQQVPVFFRPFWLDATCGKSNWQVQLHHDKSNQVDGVLVYFIYKKLGQLLIRKPPLAPHSGFWFPKTNFANPQKEYSYQKRVIKDLLAKIPANMSCELLLSPQVKNWIPFKSLGFSATPYYQFIFPFRKMFNEYRKEFKENIRRELRKGEQKLEIQEMDDIDTLHNLCNATLTSVQQVDKKLLGTLYKALREQKMGFILGAKDEEGKYQGAFLIAHDQTHFYTVAGGMNTQGRSQGVFSRLIFESLKIAHQHQKGLNLCGSILPGPAEKFMAFGAEMKTHYQVSKSSKLFNLMQLLFR